MILAIETSTDLATIALAHGDVRERECPHRLDLVRRLMPEIVNLVAEAGYGLDDIEGVAVGLGPGGFTSVRIGLATAKALAHALGVPLAGVSSLAAAAYRMSAYAQPDELLCPVLEAHRGELYAAVFAAVGVAVERRSDFLVASPESLVATLAKLRAPVIFGGEGKALAEAKQGLAMLPEHRLLDADTSPRASAVVALAPPARRAAPADWLGLQPIYVRPSAAEERLGER